MLRKHERMDSVAAEFLKTFKVPGKSIYKVKVRWWNIGRCHAPWNMGIEQNLVLTKEQLQEFRPYEWKGKSDV